MPPERKNMGYIFSLPHISMTTVWLVAMIVLLVVEASVPGLVSIWFALGAFAAMLSALLNAPLWLQFVWFAAVSLASLWLTRPFVKKMLSDKTVATNADRYINQKAFVTQKINGVSGSGQIKSMGQVWSAKSEDGLDINEGEEVIINRIDGVRAVVSKIN